MIELEFKPMSVKFEIEHGSLTSDTSVFIVLKFIEAPTFVNRDGESIDLDRWSVSVRQGGEEPDEDQLNLPDQVGSAKHLQRNIVTASVALPRSRLESLLESIRSPHPMASVVLEVEDLEETESGLVWPEGDRQTVPITAVRFVFASTVNP
jgi:hypothetical protein